MVKVIASNKTFSEPLETKNHSFDSSTVNPGEGICFWGWREEDRNREVLICFSMTKESFIGSQIWLGCLKAIDSHGACSGCLEIGFG